MTFQVCSGRHQSTRNNGRPTPAVSRDSLSSLPPPVPPPARRSSSRSHTASPLNYSQSSASAASAGVTAAGHDDVVRIRKQANLVLENPGSCKQDKLCLTDIIFDVYTCAVFFSGFHSSTAGLTAADQHEEGEKEYKLHILDPAEDCSSLASSSNRSSIVSDTGLMVMDDRIGHCCVFCGAMLTNCTFGDIDKKAI